MGTEGADGGSCTELTDLSATERPIRMVIRPEDPQKSKYHAHILSSLQTSLAAWDHDKSWRRCLELTLKVVGGGPTQAVKTPLALAGFPRSLLAEPH